MRHRCDECGIENPTWDHVEWHRRMKREQESEWERAREREEQRRREGNLGGLL